MGSIILLFVCLIIGIVVRRTNIFPSQTPAVLNQFIIYISLPAMALFYLPKIKLSSELIFPASMAWIAFAVSFVLFASLGKIFNWSKKLTGCLILTAGLGNTSFVGIPVIQALFGNEGLETLIIVDLPGTFVVLSTLGIIVATVYSRGENNFGQIFKKVFTFPPFIAFLVGITFTILGWKMFPALDEVFGKLGATVSPLALVSVGYQLRFERKSKHWKFLFLGLGYQLILLPALIYLLFVVIFKQSGLVIQVCIVEAAMAPMITAAIVASAYGLKPKLSNMMVGFGIPISFVTIAFWYWVATGI